MDGVFKILLLISIFFQCTHQARLVGKQYNVGGEVSILGDKVSIKGFSYTGAAPDAFFYVGTAGRPEQAGERGTLIQFPPGSSAPLGKYTGQDVEFMLPGGVSGDSVTWVSVWCRAYSIDFGHAWLTDNIPASSNNYLSSWINILFMAVIANVI